MGWSDRLKALKPASGEGGGVARGCLLSAVLHPVALIAIAIIGATFGGNQGALLVLPFIAFIGLAQWIYLGPMAWLLKRRGSTAMSKGVVLSGGLVMLASTLCYGGMGLMSLQNAAETKRIQDYERAHPSDYVSVTGVVTVVDDNHFEFKRDDGTVTSLRTFQGLDYIFLKKDGGFEKRTRDMLKPGVRISVEYLQERGRPPDSPTIVRVFEEGAAR